MRHINLLSIAQLQGYWAGFPVILEIYGIEAWQKRNAD
jgi:hypothetical protein